MLQGEKGANGKKSGLHLWMQKIKLLTGKKTTESIFLKLLNFNTQHARFHLCIN
jgi:hypothetical protein